MAINGWQAMDPRAKHGDRPDSSVLAEPLRFSLARRIFEARKHLGLTQKEFAREIGVSQSYLSEVENKKGKPTIEMIIGIANRFPGISRDWLLTGFPPIDAVDRGVTDGLDGDALYWAIYFSEKVVSSLSGNRPPIEIVARFTAMLYRSYLSIYGWALTADAGDDAETNARREAAARLAPIADAFDEAFLKGRIASGPPMPLFPDESE